MPIKKLLVIEDDISIQEALADIFEYENVELTFLESAQNIKTTIDSIQPDTILMDIMIPDKKGDHVTKELKESSKYQHLPIYLMSAGKDLRKKVKDAKADGFIRKPFNLQELQLLIQ